MKNSRIFPYFSLGSILLLLLTAGCGGARTSGNDPFLGKTRVAAPPTERRPVYVRRGSQEGRVIPGSSASYAGTSSNPSQPVSTSTPRIPATNYSSAEIAKGGWIPVTPEKGSAPSVATGGGVSHTAYYLNWQKVEELETTSHTASPETSPKPDSASNPQPVSYQSEFAYEKIVPQAASTAISPAASSPTTFFTKTFRSSGSSLQAVSAWNQKKAALSATFSTPTMTPQENPQSSFPVVTPSTSSSQGWLVTSTQKTFPSPPAAMQAPPHTAVGSEVVIPAAAASFTQPQPSSPVELAPGILDILSLPEKD